MIFSDKFTTVIAALLKAKSKFVKPVKDRQNTHLKNKYATLDSVLDAVTPGLDSQGLLQLQSMKEIDSDGNGMAMHVETMIIHADSGEWVKAYTKIPIVKNDPQGAGSAFTYARRYGLVALLGLSQADDDAASAVRNAKDWERMMDNAAKVDEDASEEDKQLAFEAVKAIWADCFRNADPAIVKVVQDKYEKIKAGTEVKAARGFNPNTLKKGAVKEAQEKPDEKQVDKAPPAAVESQKIDNF